jgi:hypothetical protein
MASDATLGAILNHSVVETLPSEVILSPQSMPKIFSDSARFQPSTKSRVIEI